MEKTLFQAHIVIRGRVQGVFFRANTKKQAEKLGLKGWVRNLPDGAVEAVFQGQKEKIKAMLSWAEKGPLLAKVKDIAVEWQKPQTGLDNFEIKYKI